MTERKRTMVVTVGTSMFTSASWKVEGLFASIRGYRSWVEADDNLRSPERRARLCSASGAAPYSGAFIRDEVLRCLRETGKEAAGAFEDRLSAQDAARYCAELATIIAMWSWHSADAHATFGDYLSNKYASIQLLAPADEGEEALVAAEQLKLQLERVVPGSLSVRVLKRIEGRSVRDNARSFIDILDSLGKEPASADFVISGGFKIYAAIVTHALPAGCRVYYLHEASSGELVVTERAAGGLRILTGSEAASEEVAVPDPPRPPAARNE